MCTVRRTKLIIVCLVITAFSCQIYSVFTTGVNETKNQSEINGGNNNNKTETLNRQCGLYADYYQAMRVINTLDTIVTLVVPIVLIVAMNALIIQSLFKSSQSFHGGDKHSSRRRRHRSTASISRSNSHQSGESVQVSMNYAILLESMKWNK